jgi:hypothetical protein
MVICRRPSGIKKAVERRLEYASNGGRRVVIFLVGIGGSRIEKSEVERVKMGEIRGLGASAIARAKCLRDDRRKMLTHKMLRRRGIAVWALPPGVETGILGVSRRSAPDDQLSGQNLESRRAHWPSGS